MQQVECYFKKRIYNYSLIEGDTGPVVYVLCFTFPKTIIIVILLVISLYIVGYILLPMVERIYV